MLGATLPALVFAALSVAIVGRLAWEAVPAVAQEGPYDCHDFDLQEETQAVYEKTRATPTTSTGLREKVFTGEQSSACKELPSRDGDEQYGGPTDTSDPVTTLDQYDGTPFTSCGSRDGPVPAITSGGCSPEYPDARYGVRWR